MKVGSEHIRSLRAVIEGSWNLVNDNDKHVQTQARSVFRRSAALYKGEVWKDLDSRHPFFVEVASTNLAEIYGEYRALRLAVYRRAS